MSKRHLSPRQFASPKVKTDSELLASMTAFLEEAMKREELNLFNMLQEDLVASSPPLAAIIHAHRQLMDESIEKEIIGSGSLASGVFLRDKGVRALVIRVLNDSLLWIMVVNPDGKPRFRKPTLVSFAELIKTPFFQKFARLLADDATFVTDDKPADAIFLGKLEELSATNPIAADALRGCENYDPSSEHFWERLLEMEANIFSEKSTENHLIASIFVGLRGRIREVILLLKEFSTGKNQKSEKLASALLKYKPFVDFLQKLADQLQAIVTFLGVSSATRGAKQVGDHIIEELRKTMEEFIEGDRKRAPPGNESSEGIYEALGKATKYFSGYLVRLVGGPSAALKAITWIVMFFALIHFLAFMYYQAMHPFEREAFQVQKYAFAGFVEVGPENEDKKLWTQARTMLHSESKKYLEEKQLYDAWAAERANEGAGDTVKRFLYKHTFGDSVLGQQYLKAYFGEKDDLQPPVPPGAVVSQIKAVYVQYKESITGIPNQPSERTMNITGAVQFLGNAGNKFNFGSIPPDSLPEILISEAHPNVTITRGYENLDVNREIIDMLEKAVVRRPKDVTTVKGVWGGPSEEAIEVVKGYDPSGVMTVVAISAAVLLPLYAWYKHLQKRNQPRVVDPMNVVDRPLERNGLRGDHSFAAARRSFKKNLSRIPASVITKSYREPVFDLMVRGATTAGGIMLQYGLLNLASSLELSQWEMLGIAAGEVIGGGVLDHMLGGGTPFGYVNPLLALQQTSTLSTENVFSRTLDIPILNIKEKPPRCSPLRAVQILDTPVSRERLTIEMSNIYVDSLMMDWLKHHLRAFDGILSPGGTTPISSVLFKGLNASEKTTLYGAINRFQDLQNQSFITDQQKTEWSRDWKVVMNGENYDEDNCDALFTRCGKFVLNQEERIKYNTLSLDFTYGVAIIATQIVALKKKTLKKDGVFTNLLSPSLHIPRGLAVEDTPAKTLFYAGDAKISEPTDLRFALDKAFLDTYNNLFSVNLKLDKNLDHKANPVETLKITIDKFKGCSENMMKLVIWGYIALFLESWSRQSDNTLSVFLTRHVTRNPNHTEEIAEGDLRTQGVPNPQIRAVVKAAEAAKKLWKSTFSREFRFEPDIASKLARVVDGVNNFAVNSAEEAKKEALKLVHIFYLTTNTLLSLQKMAKVSPQDNEDFSEAFNYAFMELAGPHAFDVAFSVFGAVDKNVNRQDPHTISRPLQIMGQKDPDVRMDVKTISGSVVKRSNRILADPIAAATTNQKVLDAEFIEVFRSIEGAQRFNDLMTPRYSWNLRNQTSTAVVAALPIRQALFVMKVLLDSLPENSDANINVLQANVVENMRLSLALIPGSANYGTIFASLVGN
jgi:hypothetical protein